MSDVQQQQQQQAPPVEVLDGPLPAIYEPPPLPGVQVVEIIGDEDWHRLARIAQTVSATEFVPAGLRGNGTKTMAALLFGHQQGIPPMVAITELYVVDGRVGMSAALVAGKLRQAGHELWREEHKNEQGEVIGVTAKGKRRDNGIEDAYTFTLDMAHRANLMGKHNWKTYPEAMLWARAVTQLARILFSDVFLGMAVYDVDDVRDQEPVALTAARREEDDPMKQDPLVVGFETFNVAEARAVLAGFGPENLAKVKRLELSRQKPRKTIIDDIERRVEEMPPDQRALYDQTFNNEDSSGQGADEPADGDTGAAPEPDPAGGAGEEAQGDAAPTHEPPPEPVETQPAVDRLRAYLERVQELHPEAGARWTEDAILQGAKEVWGVEVESLEELQPDMLDRLIATVPARIREAVDEDMAAARSDS